MSLLALLKIHKNTRRFYILLQAFWQAENEKSGSLDHSKKCRKKAENLFRTGAASVLQQST
jgi:hypothetical protein